MSPAPGSTSVVTDAEIRAALEPVLASPIARLERRPFEYRTSFPLEALTVELADGARHEIVCKDLAWNRLDATAQSVKPRFLHDSHREIDVYRTLARRGLGTPHLYAVDDERCRILIELVDGVPLWQIGDWEVWLKAARWAARLHREFAGDAPPASVIRHDAELHRRFLERANENVGGAMIARVARSHERVIEHLTSLPATLLHGELYASNVIVGAGSSPRIAPIDWELASWGPGVFDVAALSAGRWSEDEKRALAAAYHSELGDGRSLEDFLADLDHCRVQVAITWLGWARDWTPPPELMHDWEAELEMVADRVGLLGG